MRLAVYPWFSSATLPGMRRLSGAKPRSVTSLRVSVSMLGWPQRLMLECVGFEVSRTHCAIFREEEVQEGDPQSMRPAVYQ